MPTDTERELGTPTGLEHGICGVILIIGVFLLFFSIIYITVKEFF